MEEDVGTQICQNCNREIPKVNYVIHSVHCVRNIKICPVCKEPVPLSELEDHNDKLHMLVPCRKCGEMVRGTDMEDHTRDSCGFTLKSCRFCSLELQRRELPSHERYCGTRTERCADCGEYVMLRYHQLHLDTNHGFVRLDEDSPPRPGGQGEGDSAASGTTTNRRPRFPPYVPLANVLRPNGSVHEGIRLIGQLRVNLREAVHSPDDHVRREDLYNRVIGAAPLFYSRRNGGFNVDEEMRGLDQRQRLVANLRGRTRYTDNDAGAQNFNRRNGLLPFVRFQDAMERHAAAVDAEVPDAVAPDAEVPDAVAPNAVAVDAEVQNVVAPSVEKQDPVTPDGEKKDTVKSDGEKRDPVTPDGEKKDTVTPDGEKKDLVTPDGEKREPLTPDAVVRDPIAGVAEVGEALGELTEAGDTDSEKELTEVSRPQPSSGPLNRSLNSRTDRILKRMNDRLQIHNMSVIVQNAGMKKMGKRGAVKKRPAPAAPSTASKPSPAASASSLPAPDPQRDLPYYSALQRRQDEDRRRREQTEHNLSVGLPPVLDPAAKLEKLRKLDALHNRECDMADLNPWTTNYTWFNSNITPAGRSVGRGAVDTASSVPQSSNVEQQRKQLSNLEPMSADEFMERFNELQLFKEPASDGENDDDVVEDAPGRTGEDGTRGRFGDIRSSLRELRRGLNEVTAPYNNSTSNNNTSNKNNNNTNKNNNVIKSRLIDDMLTNAGVSNNSLLDEARALDTAVGSSEDDVMVPCEFCFEPLQASEIIDHERACRHGMASAHGLTSSPTPPITPTLSSRPSSPWNDDCIPVIPCEFCSETLPFYLINEHQEQCGHQSQLLYPD